jgi:hypothetical protein
MTDTILDRPTVGPSSSQQTSSQAPRTQARPVPTPIEAALTLYGTPVPAAAPTRLLTSSGPCLAEPRHSYVLITQPELQTAAELRG